MDISIGEDELQEIHDIVMTDVSDRTHIITHEGKHKMMTDTSNYPLASRSRGRRSNGNVIKVKFNFKPKGDYKSKREFIDKWNGKFSPSVITQTPHKVKSNIIHEVMSHTGNHNVPKVMSLTPSKSRDTQNVSRRFLQYYQWVRGDKLRSMKCIPRRRIENNNTSGTEK